MNLTLLAFIDGLGIGLFIAYVCWLNYTEELAISDKALEDIIKWSYDTVDKGSHLMWNYAMSALRNKIEQARKNNEKT